MAVQMFERAIVLDPDFALAFVGLSEALSHLTHFSYDLTEENILKAKAAADQVLELQPELPEGHRALGLYYYLCHKDYDRALEELAIAEKGLPNDSRILEYIGYILRRQGNFEEAINNLKKVFELNPQDAHILWEIGNTYQTLRRYQEAEPYYDRSISLAPDQTTAYMEKVFNYWLLGLLEKARATLDEMPKKWHINWVWQEIYERNYQGALELLSSDFVESYSGEKALNTGFVYRFMNKPELARDSFDSARVLFEKEVKEQPDNPTTHYKLGIAYAGLGRKAEAIREGKQAVELYPISKDAYSGPGYVYWLAVIYVMVGEYEEALDKIEYLFSIPNYYLSVPLLRLEPLWDPLREHPRFIQMLEKYSVKKE
jgi:serine/threonine-protein kinase